MNPKNKYIIIIAIAVLVLVLVGFGAYKYIYSPKSANIPEKPNAPEMSSEARTFLILSSQGNDQYKAKDLNSGKEVTLIIPRNAEFLSGSSEKIKNGSKIEAGKSLEASNGILITQLKVY